MSFLDKLKGMFSKSDKTPVAAEPPDKNDVANKVESPVEKTDPTDKTDKS